MTPSYMPRYIRVQNYIKEQISKGNWKEGDLIPTELELSKMFDVSRITISTALREMVKDGIIYRIQGKGTYVARRKYEIDLYKLASLYIDKLNSFIVPGSHKKIGIRTAVPESKIAAILKLDKSKKVVTFERLKYIDNIPFCIETFHFPEDIYPGILGKDLENIHLSDLLTKEYKITFWKSIVSYEPVLSDKEASKLLLIPVGAPMLYTVMEIYDYNDQPLGLAEFLNRGDKTKYVFKFEASVASGEVVLKDNEFGKSMSGGISK